MITKGNLWDIGWILIYEPIVKRKKMREIEYELLLIDN